MPEHEAGHEPEEQYVGPARLGDDQPIDVDVTLRGRFEPIDGRFHWYGRIAADPAVGDRHTAGDTVTLSTPHGRAAGRLSDVDPWGRFRISGTGRPPF